MQRYARMGSDHLNGLPMPLRDSENSARFPLVPAGRCGILMHPTCGNFIGSLNLSATCRGVPKTTRLLTISFVRRRDMRSGSGP